MRFLIALMIGLILVGSVSANSNRVGGKVCAQASWTTNSLPSSGDWLIRAYVNGHEIQSVPGHSNTNVEFVGRGVYVNVLQLQGVSPLKVRAATIRSDCPLVFVTYLNYR